MYISCVQLGGIGNQLFQLSAILSYAKDHDMTCIFSDWTKHAIITKDVLAHGIPEKSKEIIFKMLQAWGGHECRFKNIGEAFPGLSEIWEDDPNRFGNSIGISSWNSSPTDSEFKEIKMIKEINLTIMKGFFMNPSHWHHNRKHLLDVLSPSDRMISELKTKMDLENSVSIHLRFQSAKGDWMSVREISMEWYEKVLNKYFPEKRNKLVLITDDKDKSLKYSQKFRTMGYETLIMYDDPITSLFAMSMCEKGHVLHDSTFSFWGAYLDQNQPFTNTVMHPDVCFSKWIVPYKEWIYFHPTTD